jgi:type I restriction enzyme S subunit
MKPLGEVAITGSGSTPKADDEAFYKGGTVPFVRIADLNDGHVARTEICVTDKAVAQYRLKLRPAGTLLIAMYGSIGKLGLLEATATTNQAILAINPRPDLLSQRQALIHSGFGGVQKNLSGAFLKKVRVPVPPLNEQDEVVGTFAALQDMALALDEQRAQLDNLRDGLLQDVFFNGAAASSDDS